MSDELEHEIRARATTPTVRAPAPAAPGALPGWWSTPSGRVVEKALTGLVVAAIGAASAWIASGGAPQAKAPPEDAVTPTGGSGGMPPVPMPERVARLESDLALVTAAANAANGRSRECAAVSLAQAQWIASYLRMFHQTAAPVAGQATEPPLLGLGQQPLSNEPFVVELRPPRIIIATPIPAMPKE
jgi:hypothetical protein